MDIIERLFHISPDGGNGITELLLLTVFLAVASHFYFARRAARRPRHDA